jgi:purine-binding chemotaxis protein CheW
MVDAVTHVIVFDVQERRCALPLEDVAEVLRMPAVAPVPETPSWLRGALNLRGSTIPVIDLRARLGLPAPEPGPDSSIIVAWCESRMVGLVVDVVLDVLALPAVEIEPPGPAFGSASAVASIGRMADRPLIILDLRRICFGVVVDALALPGGGPRPTVAVH